MRITLFIVSMLTAVMMCHGQSEEVKAIPIDKSIYSGIGLKKVTNPRQPDRDLRQRMLFQGEDIMVFVVSSNTASAEIESYSLDEFVYLISGGASIETENQMKHEFYAGDYFLAPRGFKGKWSTFGAPHHHHELSVIANNRETFESNPYMSEPMAISKIDLSGTRLTLDDTLSTNRTVLKSTDLEVIINEEQPSSREIESLKGDILVHILSGKLTLNGPAGEENIFYTDDFVVLPTGFRGQWKSEALDHFRYMIVRKVR